MRLTGPRDAAAALAGPRPAAVAGRVALLAASGIHLGFQAQVTAVEYPELFRGADGTLPARQAEHARRIAPLVAAVYASLAGAAGWAAATSWRDTPGRRRTATVVSCLSAAAAPLLTAAATMPLHVGIAHQGADRARVEGILAADRARTVASAIGVVAAVQALRP